MIDYPTSLPGALQLINDFIRDHGSTLPAPTYAVISAYYPSPVDRLVRSTEALYGAHSSLGVEGKTLAIQLASLCVSLGWQSLGQTDRGSRLINALRRDLGEEVSQEVANDPAPLSEYTITETTPKEVSP